jgi:hypothetical protein
MDWEKVVWMDTLNGGWEMGWIETRSGWEWWQETGSSRGMRWMENGKGVSGGRKMRRMERRNGGVE